MQVLNYLKLLYSSNKILSKQVCLFSIIGLFVLSLIKYTASYGNLLLYHNFYISVPASGYELWVYLFVMLFLLVYIIGYISNLASNVMNDRVEIIPEFSLKPFYYFVKIMPIYFCWNIYFFLVGYLIYSILGDKFQIILFGLAQLILLPFVWIIQTAFVKKLKYEVEYFNPLTLLKVIVKSFFKLVVLDVQMLIFAGLPAFVLFKILTYSTPAKFLYLNLPIKLGSICLMAYIIMIFVLIYQVGLCNIVKSWFKNTEN